VRARACVCVRVFHVIFTIGSVNRLDLMMEIVSVGCALGTEVSCIVEIHFAREKVN
jgi:hypothetical protein